MNMLFQGIPSPHAQEYSNGEGAQGRDRGGSFGRLCLVLLFVSVCFVPVPRECQDWEVFKK